jgi:hypothetical protein
VSRARLCAPLFAALFFVYLITMSPDFYPGDDRYFLNLAVSLADRHSPALIDARPCEQAHPGPDGRMYAIFPLGYPVLLAITYVLFRLLAPVVPAACEDLALRLTMGTAPAALLAGASTAGAATAMELGYRPRIALLWGLGMGIATQYWPASKGFLSEPPQAFLVAVLVLLIVRYRKAPDLTGAIRLGLVAGALVHVKLVNVTAIPAVLAVLLMGEHRARRLAGAIVPLSLCAILMMQYNHLRTGAYLVHGYERTELSAVGLATPLWAGLLALFASSGKGALFYSPFLLLAAAGMHRFMRRHVVEAGLTLALIAPSLVIVAMYPNWSGDWCWGPRLLIPMLPVLGLWGLPVVERLVVSRPGRLGLAVVLFLGAGIQLLAVSIEPYAYVRAMVAYPLHVPSRDDLRALPQEGPYLTDRLYLQHFVPPFSPLVVHAWQLARMAGYQGAPPWNYLGLPASPDIPHPVPDLWWMPARAPPLPGLAALAVLAFGLSLAVRGIRAASALAGASGAGDSVPDGSDPTGFAPGSPAPLAAGMFRVLVPGVAAVSLLPCLLGASAVTVARLAVAAGAAALAGRSAARLAGPEAGARLTLLLVPSTMLWARCAGSWTSSLVALAASLVVDRLTARRLGLPAALLLFAGLSAAVARSDPGATTPFWVGLFALTLSAGKGVLIYNPSLLLALPAIRSPRPGPDLLALAALVLGIAAAGAWSPDLGWGPGLLVPAVIPLGVAMARSLARPTPGTMGLISLGLVFGLLSVAVDPAVYPTTVARTQGLAPPLRARVSDPWIGVHFVPALSPIAGQAWMARLALGGTSPEASSPPWRSLFMVAYPARGRAAPPLGLAR